MIHELKLGNQYYRDSESGAKPFEIRVNDRGFQVGDVVMLREWMQGGSQEGGAYTGKVYYKVVTYILEDARYLQSGYVCMGGAPISLQKFTFRKDA